MNPENNISLDPHQEKGPIELLAVPGLSVSLQHTKEGPALMELKTSGILKGAFSPILKKINSRLREEKPALITQERIIPSAWLPPIPSPAFKRLLFAEMQIALGKYIPETVSIELTHQNKVRIAPENREDELDIPGIKRIIDEALDLGALIITFTENDPLLREEIFELIKYVDKDRAIVNSSTWGTDFSKETADRLKEAGLHALMVGIYSTDPTKHDAIRGSEGSYEKAISTIQLALEAGLTVAMTTHASPSNISELRELYTLASDLGVHEFSVWEVMPKNGKDPKLTEKDRQTILEMYREINANPSGPRMFANSYFEGQMLGAMAGRRWLHVTAEGFVKPSPYLPFNFGNIQENTLKESWQKIRSYPYFQRQNFTSPMYDPTFLKLVDKIPDGAKLPYDFEQVCKN